MTDAITYQATYRESHALIIGINKYKYANPLAFAENDAKAVADLLTKKFGFKKRDVVCLTGDDATADAVRKSFMRYANKDFLECDDRLLVFFAGHGHTVSTGRREAGFLVPLDGNTSELSSLIRWDELTRNADLIPAKHVLFLMDACYGGLAISRKVHSGSMRFLGDMLQRYSRQVITAGKADEVVSDANGTRPGHSIFTSHLLDGLDGSAYTDADTITALGLMSYVYDKVGSDQFSGQTPHYGFIEGDGDFVFDISSLENLGDEKTGEDLLVKTSAAITMPDDSTTSLSEKLKGLIPDPSDRIKLDDLVSEHLRSSIHRINVDKFPVSQAQGAPAPNGETIATRLREYEEAVADLLTIVILLSRWGESGHRPLLKKIFSRLAETEKGSNGYSVLIALNWYPLTFLMYAAGIAALSVRNFSAVESALMTGVRAEHRSSGVPDEPLVVSVTDRLLREDYFKALPGHEQQYVPRSEYFFKALQPTLEDLLYLGRSYETYFDEFEILLALVYARTRLDNEERVWGPVGRFGWKHSGRHANQSPYTHLVEQAKNEGDDWGPLRAGLFGGKSDKFLKIAEAYKKLLDGLTWW